MMVHNIGKKIEKSSIIATKMRKSQKSFLNHYSCIRIHTSCSFELWTFKNKDFWSFAWWNSWFAFFILEFWLLGTLVSILIIILTWNKVSVRIWRVFYMNQEPKVMPDAILKTWIVFIANPFVFCYHEHKLVFGRLLLWTSGNYPISSLP